MGLLIIFWVFVLPFVLRIVEHNLEYFLFVMGLAAIIVSGVSSVGFFVDILKKPSALLDNATMAAAEVSPGMSAIQIEAILMGLLISGGMLIPGNIPNIVSAGKLRIKSKEWAIIGVPVGLVVMAVYFAVIFLI